jgi:hypothetical protein
MSLLLLFSSTSVVAHVDTGYINCFPETLDSQLLISLRDSKFSFAVQTFSGQTFRCGGPACIHSTTEKDHQVVVHFRNGAGLSGTVTLDKLLLETQPVLTNFPKAASVDVEVESDAQDAPTTRFVSAPYDCRFGIVSNATPDEAARLLREYVFRGR